jgi:ATP-dependent DNA ligase
MVRMDLPVMPPVAPMLAKLARDIPPGQLYEPKWDGFRSVVFRDGDEVELGSRNERPMTRYFPELAAWLRAALPDRCVLDGEIVVPDAEGRGLDFWSLQQRIHPAKTRIDMLAGRTPARFVAFDLLALGDDDLMERPFAERRELLEKLLPATTTPATAADDPHVHVTPLTDDLDLGRRWFEQFEGAGLDGLVAKRHDLVYQPDKRVMTKIKHERTADCVVAGYRVHKKDPEAIGSLLLGLYDDAEEPRVPEEMREWTQGTLLTSVGVIGAFPMQVRRDLYVELQALVTEFDDHPWNWAAALAEHSHGNPGSRWNQGQKKDLSFVPLRPERVVEVRYDYMEGFRFRHTAQFVRWRPDRTPESCTYAQLEEPAPFDLGEVLGLR